MKKNRVAKKKETKKQKKIKKLLTTTKKLTLKKHRAKSKKGMYGPFPYIFLITFINKNLFINISDLQGHTKLWTNAGRNGLKGKNKVSRLSIIEVFKKFLKEIYIKRIKKLILKFNGLTRHRYKIKKEIKQNLKKYRFTILAYENHIKIPFGGCRSKKKKRK